MKEGKSAGFSHWLDEGGKGKRKAQDYPAILSLNNERIWLYTRKIWNAGRNKFGMEAEICFGHLKFDMLVV